MGKPKLLILHGRKFFEMPTFAESKPVFDRFEVSKSKVLEGDPDIVYCQSFLQCGVELKKWKGPCVIPIGGYPWEFGDKKTGAWNTDKIGKLLTQNENRVVVFMSRWLVTEFKRREMDAGRGALVTYLPRGHWGMDHIISGVPPDRFIEKTDYALSDPPNVVMSINLADVTWRKMKLAGIPIMLDAVRDVARKHGVRFTCYGIRADNFPYLDEWREKYNFRSIRSHYKHDDIDMWPKHLHAADVFVHPSMYDGWGRAVADAMCTGVPTMVLNATAPPEIGDTLLVRDPEDAEGMALTLDGLLKDEDVRKKIGRSHRREAIELTEEHRGDLSEVLLMAAEGRREWRSRSS
jgi:glycosyltransferase involved in cell wall biosynthesis